MARQAGSVGIVKREFEVDFWRRCHQLKLKPGAYLADILHDAKTRNDSRTGLMALALMTRGMPDEQFPQQHTLPLVVVQRWGDPATAPGRIESSGESMEWSQAEVIESETVDRPS